MLFIKPLLGFATPIGTQKFSDHVKNKKFYQLNFKMMGSLYTIALMVRTSIVYLVKQYDVNTENAIYYNSEEVSICVMDTCPSQKIKKEN